MNIMNDPLKKLKSEEKPFAMQLGTKFFRHGNAAPTKRPHKSAEAICKASELPLRGGGGCFILVVYRCQVPVIFRCYIVV
jgi:hypothetical protein